MHATAHKRFQITYIHIYKLLFDKPNKQTDHQTSVIVHENEEILLHVFLFIF